MLSKETNQDLMQNLGGNVAEIKTSLNPAIDRVKYYPSNVNSGVGS